MPFLLVAIWGGWKLPHVFQEAWERTAFYVLLTGTGLFAKLLELGDLRIAAVIPMGGHPLKHIAGAAALVCYISR